MNKINIIVVGKVKEKYFSEAINEYTKRLRRFCELNLIEVKEQNFNDQPTVGDVEKIKQLEGEEILKRCRGFVVAMTIDGKKLSSEELSKELRKHIDLGEELSFVIGGSYGLSDQVKKASKLSLSFSDLTFPHTLFRVMLVEQIYRAFMIDCKSDYHK